MYISALKALGLTKIKKVAPELRLEFSKVTMDLQTLQGVMTHRYEIMARYGELLKVSARDELSCLVTMRRELGRVWERSNASSEQLLTDLQAWCHRAQQNGIDGIEQFALRLRGYAA